MIIHTSNIIAAPLVLAVWLLDVFVFLACMRLALGRMTGEWPSRVAAGLRPITDPIPQALARYLASRRDRAVPSWAPWLCVIGGAVAVRYLLVWIVVCDL
ncbi:MAG: hypothetical protein JXQ75_04555 [Phycisphaerae bacterium]|nr:hypothetical protein [Phycisphaerae bacterium]